jgi:hypothetical protein
MLTPAVQCIHLIVNLRQQGLANNAARCEKGRALVSSQHRILRKLLKVARAFVTALAGVDGIIAAAGTQYPNPEIKSPDSAATSTKLH